MVIETFHHHRDFRHLQRKQRGSCRDRGLRSKVENRISCCAFENYLNGLPLYFQLLQKHALTRYPGVPDAIRSGH
jgi:hypothetical protein